MKYEQIDIQINSEPALALVLHIKSLVGEYNRIVTASKGDRDYLTENQKAMELIIKKINQCRETLNWVNEIY